MAAQPGSSFQMFSQLLLCQEGRVECLQQSLEYLPRSPHRKGARDQVQNSVQSRHWAERSSDGTHRPGLGGLTLWGKQTNHQQASLLHPTSLLCFLASSQIHLAHFNLNMLTLFLQRDHLCLPFRKMIVLLVVWKSCFMADEYSSVRKSTHLAVSWRRLCTSVLCPYLKFYMSLRKEKCEPFIFHLLVLCLWFFKLKYTNYIIKTELVVKQMFM